MGFAEMIPVIDTITHQLNWMQVAKQMIPLFDSGASTVHIVCTRGESTRLPMQLRNAISRFYREFNIHGLERVGVRLSEPFDYSFTDDRVGKFICVAVQPYYSRTKAMQASVQTILKELAL